jgi:GH24 family phage-related lysozyme (muramidase)
MTFYRAAAKVFDLDEGTRKKVYKDSKGFWTVGRGHLIGKSLESLELPSEVIEALFQHDLGIAIYAARRIFTNQFFDAQLPARQMAIVSMIFTLGEEGFKEFDETINQIRMQNWDNVADRILKTKWARDIDPKQREGLGRDDRISYMFKTGEFHPEYKV